MTIGQRTAQAIREKAMANGTTIRNECEKLQITENTRLSWNRGKGNPGSIILAELYRNGYDIGYILTGEKT